MKNVGRKATAILVGLALISLGFALSTLVMNKPAVAPDEGDKGLGISEVLASRKSEDKAAVKAAVREKRKNRIKFIKKDGPKPELKLEREEEERLSDFCREVLKDIQKSLDKEDLNALVIVLEKIKVQMADARANGLDVNSVVPESVRIRAIEACGWFGADSLPEIIDSLVDESEEVRQMSIEQYQIALEDPKFGDYDRAELIKAAAQSLNDRDGLDSIFTSITDMRNSLIAETIIDIMENGTTVAKDLMKEQIEFYTESDVVTKDDVERWYKENPDDPDDDEFYGPMESEDPAADE